MIWYVIARKDDSVVDLHRRYMGITCKCVGEADGYYWYAPIWA